MNRVCVRVVAVLSFFGMPWCLMAQTAVHHGRPLDRSADVRIMALDGTVVVEGWDRDSVDVTGTVAKGMTPF
ncbi:MAG: hypothetical protein ABI120_19900, partial [Gemmatimonadaceae bacterium]